MTLHFYVIGDGATGVPENVLGPYTFSKGQAHSGVVRQSFGGPSRVVWGLFGSHSGFAQGRSGPFLKKPGGFWILDFGSSNSSCKKLSSNKTTAHYYSII